MIEEEFIVFPGRTLSVLSNTQVQFDPDLSIAHDLRRWYLEEGMNFEMADLTIPSKQQENSEKFILRLIFPFLITSNSSMENIRSIS